MLGSANALQICSKCGHYEPQNGCEVRLGSRASQNFPLNAVYAEPKVIAAWIDGIKFGAEMEALSLASLA